jgi:predicted PhzF superfamily epimerase YddE/YHI9
MVSRMEFGSGYRAIPSATPQAYWRPPPYSVAAGALGAYLVRYDRECRAGEHHFRIAQGYAMGAPSLIECLVSCEGGNITRTAIRGQAEIIERERANLS